MVSLDERGLGFRVVCRYIWVNGFVGEDNLVLEGGWVGVGVFRMR